MSEVGEVATRPRGATRLLIDPAFGGIFWGKLITAAGVWIHGVVAAIVVFSATGSAFAVGMVSIAQFVPQLLLSPLSGAWADRGHAWGQIIAGRVVCMAGSGLLAAWILVVGEVDGWAGAWPVLGASLIVGVGFVLGGPAQQSIIPRLVTTAELPAAMTLNTVPTTFARVLGPVVGAMVASHFGAAAAFGVASLAHLPLAVVFIFVRIPEGEARGSDTDYSVRAALRYVRRHRSLRLILLGVTAVGVGSEPTMTLAPSIAHDLGGGATLVGALASAFGVGAGVGLLGVGPAQRVGSQAAVATSGLVLMSLGMVAVSLAVWAPVGLLGFALCGVGFTWSMASLGTLVQLQSPPVLRGRIMALWMVGFLGGRPAAAAVLGGVADAASVRVAVALMAVLLAAVAVISRPSRLV
ncbi:MFS transporter [Nocardioides sp. cx-169]|uniref:MFS transporter n=1 Tax=Nocardioides sp. cx-169 TaxID=2899080 RepID=UPI001E298480|nr:MFS transporter [Nocardioides sp. cx-169]MCD4534900.1 MFS transporter [Nocardioides sp. cx-169]